MGDEDKSFKKDVGVEDVSNIEVQEQKPVRAKRSRKPKDSVDEDVETQEQKPVKAKRSRKSKVSLEEDVDPEEQKPVKAKRSRKSKVSVEEDVEPQEEKLPKAKRGRKSKVSLEEDADSQEQKPVKAKRGRTPVGYDPEWLEGLTVKELNKLKADIQRQMRAKTKKVKKALALKRSRKAKAKQSKTKSSTKRVTKPRVSVAKPAPIRKLSEKRSGKFLTATIQPQQRCWFSRWFLPGGDEDILPEDEPTADVDDVEAEFDEDLDEDVEMEDVERNE